MLTYVWNAEYIKKKNTSIVSSHSTRIPSLNSVLKWFPSLPNKDKEIVNCRSVYVCVCMCPREEGEGELSVGAERRKRRSWILLFGVNGIYWGHVVSKRPMRPTQLWHIAIEAAVLLRAKRSRRLSLCLSTANKTISCKRCQAWNPVCLDGFQYYGLINKIVLNQHIRTLIPYHKLLRRIVY